jgi:aryl-alcohol dehydrogenase-like predicted oxidoreductase
MEGLITQIKKHQRICLKKVVKLGLTFLIAQIYSDGRAEEILGECMADCRNEIVLTSKVGFPMGKEVNASGLSRRHIILEVENSLRRLKTDRLDFYFVHCFDPSTSMEETLRALDDLQAQGKILYPAVSNWAAWQIARPSGANGSYLLLPLQQLTALKTWIEGKR